MLAREYGSKHPAKAGCLGPLGAPRGPWGPWGPMEAPWGPKPGPVGPGLGDLHGKALARNPMLGTFMERARPEIPLGGTPWGPWYQHPAQAGCLGLWQDASILPEANIQP